MVGDSATTAAGGRVAPSAGDWGLRADGSRDVSTGLFQGVTGVMPRTEAGQRATPREQQLHFTSRGHAGEPISGNPPGPPPGPVPAERATLPLTRIHATPPP